MSYARVIPRDLFNEANLLKCYGQIYLNLEKLAGHHAELEHVKHESGFLVYQDQSDGSTTVMNVKLWVAGKAIWLRRPLNARSPWPLWAYPDDDTEIRVFDEETGAFSAEMIAFLKGE